MLLLSKFPNFSCTACVKEVKHGSQDLRSYATIKKIIKLSNTFFFSFLVFHCSDLGVVNSSISTEQEVIRCDMQDTRALLKQIEEQLNNMEAKFSKFQFSR